MMPCGVKEEREVFVTALIAVAAELVERLDGKVTVGGSLVC